MIITPEDLPGETTHRPRITREAVYRHGYRETDTAVESFLDEARLKAVQEQIDDLRKELQASSLERDCLRQSITIERAELNSEIKRLVAEKMEAQKRAIHHMGKTEEAAETLKMIKAEHAAIAEKLRKAVESLQHENDGLRKELLQAQQENEDLQQAQDDADDQYSVQIEEYKNQVQILKVTEEQYAQQINEAREQILQLTDDLSKAQTAANEQSEGSESRLLADMTEQYKRQCDLLKETEVANQILKEELNYYKSNYPDYEKILDEKLSLQRENEQAKQLQVAYRQLQEENERLHNERKQWAQFLESGAVGELNTPRDIIYRLESETRKIKESELEVKELKEKLRYCESQSVELNARLNECNTKISQLEEAISTCQIDNESLKQEKDMIVMHRDMLEAQLQSMFKLEEEATTQNDEFPLTHRISELESLLKTYQNDLAATKHRLILERSQRSSPAPEKAERILELTRSPSNVSEESRKQELERLRQENRALLIEVQNLQNEGYSDEADVGEKRKRGEEASSPEQDTVRVPNITLDNLRAQINELHNTIAQKDKRINRLHTVFKSKFDGMTGCVRQLLGYTLEFPPQGVEPVRITSAFVDGSELTFIYAHDEDDQPKIRAIGKNKNEYMNTLRGTYETFIKEQQNIPAFLSSVTLELMNGDSDTTAVYYGEYGEEGQEEYDEDQYSEEYDEMNDMGYDEGPGAKHDEPITIDDDDD